MIYSVDYPPAARPFYQAVACTPALGLLSVGNCLWSWLSHWTEGAWWLARTVNPLCHSLPSHPNSMKQTFSCTAGVQCNAWGRINIGMRSAKLQRSQLVHAAACQQ